MIILIKHKVYGALEEILDKLATDSQRSSYSVKKTTNGTTSPRTNDVAVISSHVNNVSPTRATIREYYRESLYTTYITKCELT